MSWLEGLKDELGWSVEDAALQELRQDTRKGYSTERGVDGAIKRGFFESIGDSILGNDPKLIQQRAQELYVKNLTETNSELADINNRLTAIGEKPIDIKPNTSQADINKELARIKRTLPQIEAIKGAGGDTSGLSTNTDSGTLTSRLDEAQTERTNTKYYDSPGYKQYLDQMAQSDKRFNATQQLAISQMALNQQQQANQMQIAQMNNQLQMRRQDSADRRIDRRDRQAYIQQMMAGLSTLGASLAI